MNSVEECGFCSGSGSIQYQQESQFPEGTFGAKMGHDAVEGGGRYMQPQVQRCPICNGAGSLAVPTSTDGIPWTCKECDGTGRVKSASPNERPKACPACDGAGWAGFTSSL